MNTEKQRQRRHDDTRLAESGNTRSEQLLVMPTESLTNREWLPGELLSGSPVGIRYDISDLFLETVVRIIAYFITQLPNMYRASSPQ